jgi:hypothetical protein
MSKIIIKKDRKKKTVKTKKNKDSYEYLKELDTQGLFFEAKKLIETAKTKEKNDPEITEIEKKMEIIKKIIEQKEIIQNRENRRFNSIEEEDNSFSYYPSTSDFSFNKKIFHKKEFYENKIEFKTHDINLLAQERCNNSKFNLMPNQIFLKNFISLETPYNGLLLWHGTGVGKTCTAITIAEQFKEIVKREGKKMFVLLSPSIKDNFKKQIFNSDKTGTINFKRISEIAKKEIPQCTGNSYLKEIDEIIIEDNEHLNKKINRIINNYYNFMGYDSFANYVTKLEDEYVKGYEESKKEFLKKKMRKEIFSDTVIIIDEAHHIRITGENSKKIAPPVIERVIRDADNVKLILLTATPMYNSHTEIIWLLNLLLQNDNKPIIKESDVFDKSGILKKGTKKNPGGLEILQHKARGYISYLRAENPFSFPFRLYPDINGDRKVLTSFNIPIKNMIGNTIPEANRLKHLYLVESNMKEIQYKAYREIVKSLMKSNYEEEFEKEIENEKKKDSGYSEIERGLQISNIVYPSLGIDNKSIDSTEFYGQKGFDKSFDMITGDTIKKYKYNENTYQQFGKFLQCPNKKKKEKKQGEFELADFSSKMDAIINYIYNSEGVVYIYSQFIVSGVLPLALALEQNGFKKYDNENLLVLPEYSKEDINCKSEPISYEGKRLSEYKDKKDFKQANYIIITGRDDISKNNDKEIYNSTLNNNKFGEKIKVILGSPIAGEGLDMKRIREIHVLDPWHHLNRIEQVIGRGIRNCSHMDLDMKYRNCTIFHHVATGIIDGEYADELERETIDIRVYRKGEQKSIKMGVIEKILKKTAIDCLLNKQGNMYSQEIWDKDINIETSQKINTVYKIGDKPYSKICNFQEECEYECDPECENNLQKEEIDTDTYNINFAKPNIYKVIDIISKMYLKEYIYDLNDIIRYCYKEGNNLEDMYIYSALDLLINTDDHYLIDKFGRTGKMIYSGGYYIFQPDTISNKKIPLYYRNKPLSEKIDQISLSKNYYYKELQQEREIIRNAPHNIKKNYPEIVTNLNDKVVKDITILSKDSFWENIYTSPQDKSKLVQIMFDYYIDRIDFNNRSILLENLCLKLVSMKTEKDLRDIKNILNEHEYKIFKSLFDYFLFEGRDIKSSGSTPWKIIGYRIFNNNQEIYVCFNKERNKLSEKNCNIFNFFYPLQSIIQNQKKENEINGYMDNNEGQYYFKLVDKSTVNSKKKKKSTGAVCNQISSKDSIGQLINKITEIHKFDGKHFRNFGSKINKDKSFLCYYLEMLLRYKELDKSNDFRWFYRNNEKI